MCAFFGRWDESEWEKARILSHAWHRHAVLPMMGGLTSGSSHADICHYLRGVSGSRHTFFNLPLLWPTKTQEAPKPGYIKHHQGPDLEISHPFKIFSEKQQQDNGCQELNVQNSCVMMVGANQQKLPVLFLSGILDLDLPLSGQSFVSTVKATHSASVCLSRFYMGGCQTKPAAHIRLSSLWVEPQFCSRQPYILPYEKTTAIKHLPSPDPLQLSMVTWHTSGQWDMSRSSLLRVFQESYHFSNNRRSTRGWPIPLDLTFSPLDFLEGDVTTEVQEPFCKPENDKAEEKVKGHWWHGRATAPVQNHYPCPSPSTREVKPYISCQHFQFSITGSQTQSPVM